MTNTRRIAHALALGLVTTGAGGCLWGYEETPFVQPPSGASWTVPLQTYSGSMGDVRAIDTTNGTVEGFEEGSNTRVRINAGNPQAGWWAMTQLEFRGSIHHPALVPGAHLEFGTGHPVNALSSRSLGVQVMGCSGPNYDYLPYDHTTGKVTMDVSSGPVPGSRVVAFTATFDEDARAQQVSGSFVVDADDQGEATSDDGGVTHR